MSDKNMSCGEYAKKVWEEVVEATKNQEWLMSGIFNDSDDTIHYCPLGCVVKNIETVDYDDADFCWETADIEDRVGIRYAMDDYSQYDELVQEDDNMIQYHYHNSEDFSYWDNKMCTFKLPRAIALKKFKEGLELQYGVEI